MKRKVFLTVMLFAIVMLSNNVVLAEEDEMEKSILNVYKIEEYYGGGLKFPVKIINAPIYFGTNLEYHQEVGTVVELNTTYRVSDIWFWNFYGGIGGSVPTIDINPEEMEDLPGSVDSFVVLGAEIIFWFNEVKYSLVDNDVVYRNGFKFSF